MDYPEDGGFGNGPGNPFIPSNTIMPLSSPGVGPAFQNEGSNPFLP